MPDRAFAQGTAFTYQGRLAEGAEPASGTYDLQFTVFSASEVPTAVAGPLTRPETSVSNGLFRRCWILVQECSRVGCAGWRSGCGPTALCLVYRPGSHYAALVGGNPAVVWHDPEADTLRYSFSANNGASFATAIVYEGVPTSIPALLDVAGRPAISFSSPDATELWNVRDTNLIPDTYINWIAVAP